MQDGNLSLLCREQSGAELLKESFNESTASEPELSQDVSGRVPNTYLKTDTIKKRLRLIRQSKQYEVQEVVGRGAFGAVYRAHLRTEPTRTLAIKKTPYDQFFSSREVQILKMLDHPNCVRLLRNFVEDENGSGQKMLYLVMDFYPLNLEKVISHLPKVPAYRMPYIRTYAYQLCLAVEHLHSKSVCHRDIKPQNILIDFDCQKLVLGDLGSAKLVGAPGSKSAAYVCSRFYRAPELVVGNEHYGVESDMWSVGCVLAEMWIGEPLFRGENSKDQFVRFMQVLGTPTKSDLAGMSPYVQVSLPKVQGAGLGTVLGPCDPYFLDLVWRLLQYNPKKRLTAKDAKSHPFFTGFRSQRAGVRPAEAREDLIECLRGS